MSALTLSEIYARHQGDDAEAPRRHAPKKSRQAVNNAAALPTDTPLVAAAKLARAQCRWADAASLFTQAADELPQPHGVPCATALTLRRDAHLCLSFVPAFTAHRERSMGHKQAHAAEWQRPDGALVRRLVGTRSPA